MVYADGMEPSSVATFDCYIGRVTTPSINAINVTGGKSIRISNPGDKTYYTLDGEEPTLESAEYEDEIFVDCDVTIKAFGVSPIYRDSLVNTLAVTVPTSLPPVISPTNDEVLVGTMVALTSPNGGAIYYTVDGTEPTIESELYDGGITIRDDTEIKAFAAAPGMRFSETITFTYKVPRVSTPSIEEEMKASGMLITLSSNAEGAEFYYTLNGADPDETSTLYTEPFKLKKSSYLKVIAAKEGYKNSIAAEKLIEVNEEALSLIKIGSATGIAGDIIEVPVTIQNNPGVAAYFLKIDYDGDKVRPVEIIPGEKWNGMLITDPDGGIEVTTLFVGSRNCYENGEMFTLKLEISEGLEACEIPLTLSSEGAVTHLFTNSDLAYEDGIITVAEQESVESMFSDIRLMSASSNESDISALKVVIDETTEGVVKASVCVENNPGFAAYNISLDFDSELLVLREITKGDVFASGFVSNALQPDVDLSTLKTVTAVSCGVSDVFLDGVLFTVIFDLQKSEYEESAIRILESSEFISASCLDVEFDSIENGAIGILEFIYGDIHQDGVVNSADAILLAQYLAGWQIALDPAQLAAADMHFNGSVNSADAILLAQYLAGWQGIVLGKLLD